MPQASASSGRRARSKSAVRHIESFSKEEADWTSGDACVSRDCERGAQRPDSCGGEAAARVAQVNLREQTLPGGEVVAARGAFDLRPKGVPVVGAHDPLADPRSRARPARARCRALRMGQ